MTPSNRAPSHPREILEKEFLQPLGVTQTQLANRLGMSAQQLNPIVRGKRRITAKTAVRLAKALGTTPQFWLNLQNAYDLQRAQ